MKKSLSFVALFTLLSLFMVGGLLYGANTLLNVEIDPGVVTIDAPQNLTFSTSIQTSGANQDVEEEFDGADQYFSVLDLKGADDGYNTTLQMSGDLVSGPNSIPGANVSFKSNSANPTLLSGNANTNVTIDSAATDYQTLDTARSFIRRNTAANNGVVSKYGAQVWLEIEVPAFQAVGSYTGSMVFTLIEN